MLYVVTLEVLEAGHSKLVVCSGLFSRTTWVSWYQKGKTSVDLNEA